MSSLPDCLLRNKKRFLEMMAAPRPFTELKMELHFKKCRHCRAVLDGTRNTVRLLTDGEWYPLPDGFGERLFRRLSSEYRKNKP